MAKGYWIGAYRSIVRIGEVGGLQRRIAGPVLEAAGGRFLARGGQVTAFESGLVERTVLIEFPSHQAAVDAYRSEGYQRALQVFDGAADRDVRIVEGLD